MNANVRGTDGAAGAWDAGPVDPGSAYRAPDSAPEIRPAAGHSDWGRASLLTGLVALAVLSLLFGLAVSNAGNIRPEVLPHAGWIMLGCVAACLAGAALALIGLFDAERKRLTAWLGLLVNGVPLVLFALLLVISNTIH